MLKAAFAALALTVLLAGCGGGGGGSNTTAQPPGSVKVTMSDFKFDPNALTVPAGKSVFYLVNNGPASHDMTIADSSGKVIAKSSLVQSGDTSTFTVDNLAAGKYQVYCDVVGHKDAGMVGTLTVT